MEIKLRTFILVIVLFLVLLFAGVNWPLFMEPSTLNLLFATVVAPLGLVMLGIVGGLTVLYLLLLGTAEAGAMVGNRKTTRELEETRKLALSAEESRLKELGDQMDERLGRIEEKVNEVLRRNETQSPVVVREAVEPTVTTSEGVRKD
jgi:uncharacterized integral membrane protein